MSIIAEAFAQYRECRADYAHHLEHAYAHHLEHATNGVLLNAEGRARGVDALSLFMGPAARAEKYASEELIEHWRTNPRVTFARFEQQWAAQRQWEMTA